jgi:amidohydrolase
MIDLIKDTVAAVLPEVIELRHRLHEIPELAGEEFKTAALVRETLAETGIDLLEPFIDTDVVGLLQGRGEGRAVALRADMDALPQAELNELPYNSMHTGRMHGCGHDGHTALLLGTALVLNKLRAKFDGSVRFVFQPGEEIAALGRNLVEAGALLNPEPDVVYAMHGWAGLPVGTIASRPGPMMASADFFTLTIKGKSGHGSKPDLAVDPINVGAHIVTALQAMPARQLSALEPVVVNVCTFHAGDSGNIIPSQAVLSGTTRYFKPEYSEKIPVMMEQIIRGICESFSAEYEFKYEKPYIPTVNDPGMVDFARDITVKYLGENVWVDFAKPSTGGEDFSFYLDKYPGAMLFLGQGVDSAPLHNQRFDFNDDALANAITFMVAAAIEFLNKK